MKLTLGAGDYTFNPTLNQVTLNIAGFAIGNLYAIINTTTGNQVLYAAGAGATLGYSSVSGSTIAVTTSTAGMSATDSLLIVYDSHGAQPLATSQSIALATNQYAGDPTTGPALPVRSVSLEGLLQSILIELQVMNKLALAQSPPVDDLDRLRADSASELQVSQVVL